MKKKLFKLLAVMLCLCLVLTACSKDDTEDDNDRRNRRTATETPEEDKPTEAVTDVPTVTEAAVPTETEINDITTKDEDSNIATTAPTAEPTAEPTTEPTAEPTPEPTEEPTPEPTEEPTPEPTTAPVVDGGNGIFNLSDVTEDGRGFTKDELISLANALMEVANYDKTYMYMDTEMSMASGGQSMDMIMTETLYKNGKIQHMLAYTDMMGSSIDIDSYTVDDGAGNITAYTSYDGGTTWSKGEGAIATLDSPLGNGIEEFANFFKDGYIKETTTGYTITGQMQVEEDGIMIKLDCEIYLDTEGKVAGYKMTLVSPVSATEDGIDMTITKLDLEFEADCPEIEIPDEALNAKEFDINDASDLLGGLAQ